MRYELGGILADFEEAPPRPALCDVAGVADVAPHATERGPERTASVGLERVRADGLQITRGAGQDRPHARRLNLHRAVPYSRLRERVGAQHLFHGGWINRKEKLALEPADLRIRLSHDLINQAIDEVRKLAGWSVLRPSAEHSCES